MTEQTPTIVMPGASGFLGRALAEFFAGRGWRVIVLSRRADVKVPGAEVIGWDGHTLDTWAQALDGSDVCLNLVGRSVNCRYSAKNRAEIEQSRVRSTT